MKTSTYRISTDLEEIYLAALKRQCSIRVHSSDPRGVIVEITEDNGVGYRVILHNNESWMQYNREIKEILISNASFK